MADVLYLDIEELMGSNKNLDYKIEPSDIVNSSKNETEDTTNEMTSKIKDLLSSTKKISFDIKTEGSLVSDKSKTRVENSSRPFIRN